MKLKVILGLLCIGLILSCRKNNPVTPVVYHQDGEVSKLYYNNPDGVNIVVLGDGFVKDDLKQGGNYDIQVKKVIDYLFTVAPFHQNKQYFNSYVIYTESAKRGAGHGFDSNNTSTKFQSYFDTSIQRLLTVGNYDTCYKYVEKAVPLSKAHLIIMLVNDDTYGGSGGSVAVASTNELSKYVLVHETGHTLGGLADEYVDSVAADRYSLSVVPFLPNIDTNSDPKRTKWAHFLDYSSYQGVVGAFEGGFYRAKGYYRPEAHSIMSDLSYLNYNAPSREAIVKRIDQIVNVPYDFNAFLKDDAASIQPVKLGVSNIPLIKNDFIQMKDRILLLQKNKYH